MSPSLSYHIQGIFQDVEHGVSTNPWGSFPFSSPLPLSPSFPHEAGGRGRGCCAKVGGINPPEGGVGNSDTFLLTKLIMPQKDTYYHQHQVNKCGMFMSTTSKPPTLLLA